MKKFLLKTWLLLTCLLLGVGTSWAEKITDYSDIVSGKKYYIGATNSSTDYYLSVDGSSTSTSIAGTAVTDKSKATVFVFEGSGTSWTIKFDGTSNYLGLKSSKDNGKVQVVSSAATFTLSNQSEKIRLTIGNYSVQKNNSGTQFGSYANTQTDVWLEEVGGSTTDPDPDDEGESASFIFNTDAGLSALGITKPNTNAGTNLGSSNYTSGDIIMTATDGSTATRVWNSSGTTSLRVYAGNSTKAAGTLTFSGETITKIVFTGTVPMTANVGTFSDKTWTGSASSVTFTATNSVTINTIKVTYEENDDQIRYNVNCASVTGGTISANFTKAVEGALVTLTATPASGYSFGSWSVSGADVDNATSAITTFTMPAADVNVSAVFNAKPARPANEVFYESFDTNDGTGGNDDNWNGTIASSDIKSDNLEWIFVQGKGASNCAKFGTSSALGSATTPAIAASGNFTLTFKAAAWDGKDESTTLKLSATGATLSVSSVTLTKGAWNTYNVNIKNATEGFTITFEGNAASNSRFFLDEVSIVKAAAPTTAIVTVNPACTEDELYYATYSNTSAFVVPSEITVYEVMVVGDEIAFEDYKAGAVVPANTGVLICALEGGNYEVELTSAAGTSVLGDANALRATGNGITAEAMADADPDKEYFRLTMHNGTQCGFWYGAENGAAFALVANKAYLVADAAAGARGFSFADNSEALESIEMNAATTIYTLNGVKVNELQKGLNIVNGKKVMVK